MCILTGDVLHQEEGGDAEGGEERNFAERAGHLESLWGKKRKVTTIRTFGLSSSDCVGNIRPVQTHTHP